MSAQEWIALVGSIPAGAEHHGKIHLGAYQRRSELVNGRPSYVKIDNNDVMMWFASCKDTDRIEWISGLKKNLGQHIGPFYVRDCASTPKDITAVWHVAREAPSRGWSDAPSVHIISRPSNSSAEEVTVVSTRTAEQRNAEGKRHALDLNLFEAKRQKTVGDDLQAAVAKARSTLSPAVDKKVKELIRQDMDLFVADQIDGVELGRRKAVARAKAEKDHKPLSEFDALWSDHQQAVAARVAAEEEVEKMMATEDATEAKLRSGQKNRLDATQTGWPVCITRRLCEDQRVPRSLDSLTQTGWAVCITRRL